MLYEPGRITLRWQKKPKAFGEQPKQGLPGGAMKSMDADQGQEMVEGNYVKLSEAWDSNVSKARAPTASRETVGKKHF